MCLQVCMHVWVEVEEMADEKKKEDVQVYYNAEGEDEKKKKHKYSWVKSVSWYKGLYIR